MPCLLTKETNQFVNDDFFEKMKPTGYFINIGRGQTVNGTALIHALQTHQIARAGLDVFQEEPLPESSLLWKMKNVIMTAHYTGGSPSIYEKVFDVFIDNLQRYFNNEPMRNVIDKQQGY